MLFHDFLKNNTALFDMNKQLPRLRRGLDILLSPVPEKPGLLFRDPFRYTEEILIIPPLLAAGLSFFDGESTALNVQIHLSKLAGQLIPGEVIQSLVDALDQNGFLETEEFERMRRAPQPIRRSTCAFAGAFRKQLSGSGRRAAREA